MVKEICVRKSGLIGQIPSPNGEKGGEQRKDLVNFVYF